MKVFRFIIFILVAVTPLSSFGRQIDYKSNLSGPIDISAESLEEKRGENTYVAKGKVEVREGPRVLNADFVTYNQNTQEVFAEGNVVFRDQADVIRCERLSLNLLTKTGTIEKGNIFIKEGNFHIVGEKIDKVGDSEYNIVNGELTTCEGETPSWKFVAKDVEMTVEGYAKTKGTRFQILNHTVFYLPWGAFPVKAERQSGFLMPQIRFSSRDGPTLRNNSYFIAISKDTDATLSLDLIGNRGFKPGAEFRYAISEDLKGSWFASIIEDRTDEGTRFQIRGQHEQLFKDAAIKVNANYVSDFNYIKDFGLTTVERSQNLLKTTGFVEKPFQKSLTTYETSYFKDLTQRNNDNTFQYLPFASFFTEYVPILKDKLYTNMYSAYTNFYRKQGDTYSRFAFQPEARLPFSFNGVNLLLNGTLYETGYLINNADTGTKNTELRQTAQIEGDMNVQFLRNYNTEWFNIGQMQSLIKPQLRYLFIPNTSISKIPDIDPYDRILQTNTLTYGFNHYLNSFTPSGFKEKSLFEVTQTYGLSGNLNPSTLYDGSGNRLSDITTRLTVYPRDGFAYINQNTINTSGQGISIMRNSIQYRSTSASRFLANVTHSYTNQLVNELYYDLNATYKDVDGRYQMRYSFADGKVLDTLYQLRYHPDCWALTLQLIQSTRPSDTTIRVSFDFIGITTTQVPYP
jgi:LPS-assembly protein